MNNYLIELYCAAEKTITVKGKAPVDNEYPSSSSVHVFYDDKDIWDCMLNQDLIRLICDIKAMEEAVVEMKYDAKKAPLVCMCVSYRMKPPERITTLALLQNKMSLLEALGDIEIAVNVLKAGDQSINPVDRHYLSLECNLQPMNKSHEMYEFGKGVYFADCSSKSANYCFPTKTKNVGLLLLCEVALGKSRELLASDYYANKLPKGMHSVKGCGKNHPNPASKITK
ncbi:PARP2 [Bugula neritina]|uniref:Poly [ADP-ribose] polymerase n=1 Tax=Bugula neritina TaxID=10212 RepID=A0A7J7K396_BUGNE|nr:PARP2 [Bugula neritina]